MYHSGFKRGFRSRRGIQGNGGNVACDVSTNHHEQTYNNIFGVAVETVDTVVAVFVGFR